MPPPVNPETYLAAAAHRALADVMACGTIPHVATACAEGGGWQVTVTACPAEAPRRPEPELTPAERDILSVLGTAERLTTKRVMSALARARKALGERTVKGVLADLVARGLVLNSRRAPRGYYLPTQRELPFG